MAPLSAPTLIRPETPVPVPSMLDGRSDPTPSASAAARFAAAAQFAAAQFTDAQSAAHGAGGEESADEAPLDRVGTAPRSAGSAGAPRPPSTIAAAPSPERARRMMQLLADITESTDAGEQARRRAVVVREYLPVARSIAARYRGRGVERGDLEQLASLGLVKSVARWLPDRSEDFLQFAVPTISGEIKRYFRDHSWTVRPPRRVQELRVAIGDAEQIFWQRHGRRPTDPDIARIVGVSAAAVAEARTAVALCRPPSLDADAGTGWVMAQSYGEVDHDLARVEDRLAVERLLSILSDQERKVVDLRFQHGWSQSQIAQEVGVSQMQISRWLRDITGKLRTACA
ncbi:sigma-70 family RNA polymerase sigma factor [Nakamurella flavida]|uniref:Sigma-70 family RNA polymerase sigma factor n=1 Tax=Nakamurella flavida TaxID=363630 RepID=A0A939C720_9ACTN|nr:sigma-70 family RNA polymerase sigma factor [Nakamurella flavida]MBM9477722.1 sigma-70 family RNA polymerase sigma factor [Nakamurella flavida]MDP9779274.1 RNA polymerase sigma-B factor [Nakamurella flavida]